MSSWAEYLVSRTWNTVHPLISFALSEYKCISRVDLQGRAVMLCDAAASSMHLKCSKHNAEEGGMLRSCQPLQLCCHRWRDLHWYGGASMARHLRAAVVPRQ